MSDIRYKWVLDNDTKGKQEIDEPIGGKDLEIQLERNIEDGFFGLIQLFSQQTLGFYGDAKDYLQDVLDTDGIDGEVRIDIDISEDGGVTFSDYFDGVVDFDGIERVDDQELGLIINARINESSFYQKIKSRLDAKVDLNLNTDFSGGAREAIGTNSVTFHSQTIRHLFKGVVTAPLTDSESLTGVTNPTRFIELNHNREDNTDLEKHLLDELTTQLNASEPAKFFTIKDIFGTYTLTVDTNIDLNFTNSTQSYTTIDIFLFHTINGGAEIAVGSPVNLTPGNSNDVNTNITVATSVTISNLKEGDTLKFFCRATVQLGSSGNFDIDFSINTQELTLLIDVDYPSTAALTIKVHEAGNKITNAITEANGTLKSEYLGNKSTSIQTHAANGCGSFCALISGHTLRGISHPFSMSFKEWFNGLDAIWNLGMDIESTPLVRVEEKKFFFGTGSPSVTILGVDNLSRSIATDLIYNSVRVGYGNWKTGEVPSTEDFATIREYASRLKRVGNKKDIISEFVAASYAIEHTRRTSTNTEDWKFDDETFIISLNRAVDGSSNPTGLGTPEKDENFSGISGLTHSEDAYNLRLSAGRNFLRWGNIASAGLLEYAGSEWLIQSGEGNLDLISIQDGDSCEGDFNGGYFDEGGNIFWDYATLDEQTPLFKPFRWRFSTPLTKADFDTIVADKRNTIEVETFDGVLKEMFIWSLKYMAERPLAEFECIEANV